MVYISGKYIDFSLKGNKKFLKTKQTLSLIVRGISTLFLKYFFRIKHSIFTTILKI